MNAFSHPKPSSTRLACGVRFLLITGVILAACGCSTTSARSRTCGILLLVNGQHIGPSFQQFQAVDRTLGSAFAERGYTLVSDLAAADLLATIELRPNAITPDRTDFIVRDLGPNTFSAVNKTTLPSIRESDREHAEAMSGFTRGGD